MRSLRTAQNPSAFRANRGEINPINAKSSISDVGQNQKRVLRCSETESVSQNTVEEAHDQHPNALKPCFGTGVQKRVLRDQKLVMRERFFFVFYTLCV